MNVIKPGHGRRGWTLRKVCPDCGSVLVFADDEVDWPKAGERRPPTITCGGCDCRIILDPWERQGPWMLGVCVAVVIAAVPVALILAALIGKAIH